MASSSASSLSRSHTPLRQQSKPLQPDSFPPAVDHAQSDSSCDVKRLHIKVDDGPDGKVIGFLHVPATNSIQPQQPPNPTAAILLSGAGGGVVGPSSIYLSIADKLASLPPSSASSAQTAMLALRLDYRYPARTKYCLADVRAAADHLEREHGVRRFVLVGWSFGGAPVFTFGGMDARCVGAATVASQTAETEGIRRMPPRPVLLLHGTADRTLSPACSARLKGIYEGAAGKKGGDVRLRLFEGDDHALTKSSAEAESLLCEFVLRCADVRTDGDGVKGVVQAPLTVRSREEKVELMRKGGDLRGAENVE